MGQKYKTYEIHCGQCGAYLLTYHKHGAGKGILRLYLANIAGPAVLVESLEAAYEKVNEVPNLVCPGCGEVIGVPAVSKGKRWAYRMKQGYFHRKLKR